GYPFQHSHLCARSLARGAEAMKWLTWVVVVCSFLACLYALHNPADGLKVAMILFLVGVVYAGIVGAVAGARTGLNIRAIIENSGAKAKEELKKRDSGNIESEVMEVFQPREARYKQLREREQVD